MQCLGFFLIAWVLIATEAFPLKNETKQAEVKFFYPRDVGKTWRHPLVDNQNKPLSFESNIFRKRT